MKVVRICGVAAASWLAAAPAFAGVGDTIGILFDERADTDIRDTSGSISNRFVNNPDAYSASPMVTLGGVAHYDGPWEVMVAWNTTPTNGPGNETQEFGGTGTITFDQIPPLPAGEYHAYLSFNIANWNNGSPVGIQMGGTGVTELGNESPGAMHYCYPPSNTGQDTILTEIAGPHMGPGSGYIVKPDGTLHELLTAVGPLPIPTGSNTNIFDDGNSFATSVVLAPGNELVLSLDDGAAVGYSHLRGYSMVFSNVAPFVVEGASNATVRAARMQVATGDGLSYGLQCTTDPGDTNGWTNTGTVITGNGSGMYFFDPTGPDEAKVYRVVRLEN